MERLTEKQSAGYDLKALNGEWCNHYCHKQRVETCNECGIWEAIQKLAEYEETGLTPQEIEQMKARVLCDKPKCKHNWVYIGLDEYRCTKCGARRYT